MSYQATFSDANGSHTIGGHDDEACRRCAMGFNPSGDEATHKIKGFCVGAMRVILDERERMQGVFQERKQELEDGGGIMPQVEIDGHNDAMRCFATALTHLETGQMFAVKGLHAPKNAGA